MNSLLIRTNRTLGVNRASGSLWQGTKTYGFVWPRQLTTHAVLARTATLLIAIGLLASFVCSIELTREQLAQPSADKYDVRDVSKLIENRSAVYYACHGVEIFALLLAGGIGLVSYRPNHRSRATLWFALFLLAAAAMTVRGYTVGNLLSTKLVGSTGPVPCLVSLLAFYSARWSRWQFLRQLYAVWAFALCVLIAAAVATSAPFYTHAEGASALGIYLNALLFPAAFLVFDRRPYTPWAHLATWLPLAIFASGTILTQTRLNLVMFVAVLGTYIYVEQRTGRGFRTLGAMSICVAGLLSCVVLLRQLLYSRSFELAISGFQQRMYDDTRTGQLREFFLDVRPWELIVGRGSQATWMWGGYPWGGGLDVGYLTLLFYGGAPLLIGYLLFHISPAVHCIRRPQSRTQLACAMIVLLWTLRMFSSSYPSLTLDYYAVLFCVGGCISESRGYFRFTNNVPS